MGATTLLTQAEFQPLPKEKGKKATKQKKDKQGEKKSDDQMKSDEKPK